MIQGHLRVLGGSLITETGRACWGPFPGQGAGVRSRCTVWGWPAGLGSPSAVRLGLRAAQWPGRPKGKKGEEEMKSRWLKYSVSLGVG